MEKQKPEIVPTVGIVVFNPEGKTLLVEHLEGATHLTGIFGLVGGRIEDGEKSVDAAVRELQEESGLKAERKSMRFVKQYYAEIFRKDGVKRMSWDVYVCTEYSGKIASSDETKPLWVTLEELEKIENILPNVKNAIWDAQKLF